MDEARIRIATSQMRAALTRRADGSLTDPKLEKLVAARDGVLARFQPVFAAENLSRLTAEAFREFLVFENNCHWAALQRKGPSICADMPRLRRALAILLDEGRPIEERLNELVPARGKSYVPHLGKAILTPILLVMHPDKYGVWNNTTEAGMHGAGVWPNLPRPAGLGTRYAKVNDVILRCASALNVDLWLLDALWWRMTSASRTPGSDDRDLDVGSTPASEPEAIESGSQMFGLERHLHEFLRDNWERTDLGKEWRIFEEDGDADAGYEYATDIGRIDLLAKHKTDARWLVVELKRQQTSDQTVGQVLRYVGWVKKHLARDGDRVDGLIVAHEDEPSSTTRSMPSRTSTSDCMRCPFG